MTEDCTLVEQQREKKVSRDKEREEQHRDLTNAAIAEEAATAKEAATTEEAATAEGGASSCYKEPVLTIGQER